MLKIYFVIALALGYSDNIFCQTERMDSLLQNKPIPISEEVIVYAYGQKRNIKDQPVTISVLDKTAVTRTDQTSFVSAVNTVPGVKMDERSPGSYRISIRGNLLRSTFGVRNVKVYLDGLPYTDASGTTYFNELAVNSIDKIAIIKCHGASM